MATWSTALSSPKSIGQSGYAQLQNLAALRSGTASSSSLSSLPESAVSGEDAPKRVGSDGATSIKAEIISTIPAIQDASQFRRVRKMVKDDLGGAIQIRDELIFSGFIDPDTNLLTTNAKPFNVFAQVAKGVLKQPKMEGEQEALGQYKDRFRICSNRPENDIHWDSSDPAWTTKASMSRRHRFLTTKNLHYQWFNALVIGLVPEEDGGVGIHRAVEELKAMKAAALLYAKATKGWSKNVGLFVNVFGHNSVNSLFIHVLDMDHTGPAFEELGYKNCPLDLVLKVLEEEAAASPNSRTSVQSTAEDVARKSSLILKTQASLEKRRFFFAGTDGATSIKAEITGRIPILRDAATFREARRIMMEDMGGCQTLREELARSAWVDRDTDKLTVGTKPFNIFARVAAGVMKQPNMEAENEALGEFGKRYLICCNRPENDEHWDSEDPEWVGKASMSMRHRFLTTKDMHWSWFNALTFGKVPREQGGATIEEAIAEVESMRAAALTFAAATPGWSEKVGLFFHVFGHNSVNSLHLHILDMSATGPTFTKYDYKNCPLDAVLKVLKEELSAKAPAKRGQFDNTAQAAAEAATAAATAATAAATAASDIQQMGSNLMRLSAPQRTVADCDDNIMDLNIGGKLTMSVARSTMLQAPQKSLLHRMFSDSWDSPALQSDAQGRIFLDFPATSFEYIVDHLRLLSMAPPEMTLQPPVIPPHELPQLKILATILGVHDFILSGSKKGRGESPFVVDIDSDPCCSGFCTYLNL